MAEPVTLRTSVRIEGTEEVLESLRGVKFGVGNRVLNGELRKLAGKAAKLAKSLLTTRRTGLLKKSIGYIYKAPRRRDIGGGVYVVGPRRSFKVHVNAETGLFHRGRKFLDLFSFGGKKKRKSKLAKRIVKKFAGMTISPSRYAHLVEGGRYPVGPHKTMVLSDGKGVFARYGGKLARGVRPRPFIAPAAKMVATSGRRELVAGVKAGIERVAAQYAKRGKTIYGSPGT